MFGWFDGLFGESSLSDAAETALELCLLEEMERESKRFDRGWSGIDADMGE